MNDHVSLHGPSFRRMLFGGLLLASLAAGAGASVGELVRDPHFDFQDQARDWVHYASVWSGGSGWSDVDAGNYPGGFASGSLTVVTLGRSPLHNSYLCLPVVGGAEYRLSAEILAPWADPAWPVSLWLSARTDENCWGALPDSDPLPSFRIESGSSTWRAFESEPFTMPSGARSVLVTFEVRFFATLYGANQAYLDNLSLVGEIPSDVPAHLYVGGPEDPIATGGKLGRFAIGATWRAYDGSTGVALPQRLTADSGNFYFFAPANVELTVKVLDACVEEFGQRFWVFIAGMTDVEVEIVVRDLWLGTTQTYFNPLGRPFVTITDHESFPCWPPLD